MSNVANLPKPDLDPVMMAALSDDNWTTVGRTCRMALVITAARKADYNQAVGEIIDGDPQHMWDQVEIFEQHRELLQRCLALLRAADKKTGAALNVVLTARGA